MEENAIINKQDEDNKFSIRYKPVDIKNSHRPYEGGWCGLGFEVFLSGVNLKEYYGSEPLNRQLVGHLWHPYSLISIGEGILNGYETYNKFGDGSHIDLHFEPEGNYTLVSLCNSVYNPCVVAFDPSIVRPARVTREHAAFQFFNAYNDLFGDVVKYDSKKTICKLIEDQTYIRSNPKYRNLFESRGRRLHEIPEEFRHLLPPEHVLN